MALLLGCWTLDLGSDYGLRVVGSSPTTRSALRTESACDALPLSLPLPLPLLARQVRALSLNK